MVPHISAKNEAGWWPELTKRWVFPTSSSRGYWLTAQKRSFTKVMTPARSVMATMVEASRASRMSRRALAVRWYSTDVEKRSLSSMPRPST